MMKKVNLEDLLSEKSVASNMACGPSHSCGGGGR